MARMSENQEGLGENVYISEKLDEVASLLTEQDASPFRVRAYQEAAAYIRTLDFPLRGLHLDQGTTGLEALPTIGASIASAIDEILRSGRLQMIDRLRGAIDPEKLFQTVPMIGPKLAKAIHEDLGLETLEALEIAAHDGRLAGVKGIGARRVRGIQLELAEVLARRRPGQARRKVPEPPVALVLEVERDYRELADAGRLPLIAPRRFNPDGRARLPILHTDRGEWRFTALYSNTPLAHRLGRTKDWVVVYFERDGQAEGQCTVVTEHRGPLRGKRVIRGSEAASMAYYDSETRKLEVLE